MVKVITYGTFDLLHYGHINLLKAAKALGDYLIVGITTENFDRSRGKLFVRQSLSERISALQKTGLADEIVLEEYEGQKIDDIRKYGADIFAVGSDWVGKFDYLSDYCKVVYLPRTQGISSTDIRNSSGDIKLGIVGGDYLADKFTEETRALDGAEIVSRYVPTKTNEDKYDKFLDGVDAVYVVTSPAERYGYVKNALNRGKHVICETPITMSEETTRELFKLAERNGAVLFDALKTGYSLAFQRMITLLKTGAIGKIVGIDAACTSLSAKSEWYGLFDEGGGAFSAWCSYLLLPVFKIFGTDCKDIRFVSCSDAGVDVYTRAELLYDCGEASLIAGSGVKSDGSLVISGTDGYVYVPAPWWKTDYFEVKKEDSRKDRRYFYPFESDGIRYEAAEFLKAIRYRTNNIFVSEEESIAISRCLSMFREGKNLNQIV